MSPDLPSCPGRRCLDDTWSRKDGLSSVSFAARKTVLAEKVCDHASGLAGVVNKHTSANWTVES